MKAHTALEALYPEVQKKYGTARYGEYKGKTGIEVLFPNGRAFISDDDFDALMKMHPGEPADELLFSLFVGDNEDDEDDEDISDEERLGTGSGLKSQGDYLDSDNEEDVDMYYAINDLRKYLTDNGHATGSIKPMDFDNNMDKVRKLHDDAWLYKDNPRNADVLKKYAKKRFDSWSDWKNNNGPVPEDEELKAEYEQKFIDDWNPKRAAIFDELFDSYDSKADTRKNLLNGIQDKML